METVVWSFFFIKQKDLDGILFNYEDDFISNLPDDFLLQCETYTLSKCEGDIICWMFCDSPWTKRKFAVKTYRVKIVWNILKEKFPFIKSSLPFAILGVKREIGYIGR